MKAQVRLRDLLALTRIFPMLAVTCAEIALVLIALVLVDASRQLVDCSLRLVLCVRYSQATSNP